jgi:predicted DNA-binding transcriptional regulator YafY
MNDFFTQARANLRDSYTTANAGLEHEWLDKVRVISTNQALLPPKVNTEVFEQVTSALFGNFMLDLDYKNAEDKTSQARVMPLGLAQQGPIIYLVCRFKNYSNERSLALHRISLAKATATRFERPVDFNLTKYDADGRFGFGEGKRIVLTFHVTKNSGYHLLESPLSEDQHVDVLEDGCKITATVVETAQLNRWLRGFGETVTQVNKEPVA